MDFWIIHFRPYLDPGGCPSKPPTRTTLWCIYLIGWPRPLTEEQKHQPRQAVAPQEVRIQVLRVRVGSHVIEQRSTLLETEYLIICLVTVVLGLVGSRMAGCYFSEGKRRETTRWRGWPLEQGTRDWGRDFLPFFELCAQCTLAFNLIL